MVSSKRNTASTNSNTTGTVASSSNSSSNDNNSGPTNVKGSTSVSVNAASGLVNKTITMNEKKDKHVADECGLSTKYKEGERVLCFEPDPTKVRVIYDAKILQISIISDEKKTKSSPEFLVHFQGWNASWDRFVPQSYLLKDNQENRSLQKTLFEKAELLSKSKKKKKKKTIIPQSLLLDATRSEGSSTAGTDGEEESEDITRESYTPTPDTNLLTNDEIPNESDSQLSSKEKSSLNSTRATKRTSSCLKSGSGQDNTISNASDENSENLSAVPIQLSDSLRQYLEDDYLNVNKKRKLAKVPAEPNIITVLEDFVRHYAAAKMVSYEKQRCKTFYTSNRREEDKLSFEKAVDAVNMAKEVAEGVRILLDFNLDQLLLYGQSGEQEQYDRLVRNSDCSNMYGSSPTKSMKKDKSCSYNENVDLMKENINIQIIDSNIENSAKTSLLATTALRERRKISLSVESKTSSIIEIDNTGSKHSLQSGGCSSRESTISGRSSATPTQSLLTPPASSPTTPQAIQLMRSLHEWQLVPRIDSESNLKSSNTDNSNQRQKDSEILPSLIYGPIHLLRLFVKMPEILGRMKIPQKRSKIIIKYVDSLLKYLESQPDLFKVDSIYE